MDIIGSGFIRFKYNYIIIIIINIIPELMPLKSVNFLIITSLYAWKIPK
uniref:Uncharacterized 5.6 kDa protein in COX1 intron n=1 Tax=Emericella nidulans TaxID=162425 RepID=YMCF_EMEND|nr:RecName: Full=Uncharacterized 5.6 kDa protein in COX1 intron; AltName: Full=URF-F [Aspergillus nidulans]AAA99211.1 unknown protein [Aspergillus nidulans]CAA30642.1 unnamed protein product [Aspergillus nidulans]